MDLDNVVRKTWEHVGPELAEQGFELVEVECGRYGAGHALRLFLDRDGGITLDQCAEAAQFLGLLLDRFDFIDGKYMLEVSSPGIARPLRKPRDFVRFTGEAVKVQSVAPVEGRKRFTGRLVGFDDGLVRIDVDGALFGIHIENVKKAHLDR